VNVAFILNTYHLHNQLEGGQAIVQEQTVSQDSVMMKCCLSAFSNAAAKARLPITAVRLPEMPHARTDPPRPEVRGMRFSGRYRIRDHAHKLCPSAAKPGDGLATFGVGPSRVRSVSSMLARLHL
jgi:hypothetical protein